jgi:hypothetical protein
MARSIAAATIGATASATLAPATMSATTLAAVETILRRLGDSGGYDDSYCDHNSATVEAIAPAATTALMWLYCDGGYCVCCTVLRLLYCTVLRLLYDTASAKRYCVGYSGEYCGSYCVDFG